MIEPNSELVIDYEHVRNNIQLIKSNLSANCKIMGVIKSNAYGHDLKMATQALDGAIDGYGVVRLEEALKIRESSSKPILAMQGVYSSDAYDALKQNKPILLSGLIIKTVLTVWLSTAVLPIEVTPASPSNML